MKTKIFAIVAALMLMAAPAMAQIYMTEEDLNNARADGDPSLFINLPQQYNSGEDWYAPVGEGLAVLTVMAGAYLIGKRKKKE